MKLFLWNLGLRSTSFDPEACSPGIALVISLGMPGLNVGLSLRAALIENRHSDTRDPQTLRRVDAQTLIRSDAQTRRHSDWGWPLQLSG